MAKTPSNMLPLGTVAPDFNLPNVVTGKIMSFMEVFGAKGTVIMFICNHCPYVIHVLDQIIFVAKEYMPKGIGFAAISANDVTRYPEDSPEKMKLLAESKSFPFPYLYDESQTTAKAYEAACTPDFYLFDQNKKCVYRGRLDKATPGNGEEVNGADLRLAIDQLLHGTQVFEQQIPSMGCNIKWKN